MGNTLMWLAVLERGGWRSIDADSFDTVALAEEEDDEGILSGEAFDLREVLDRALEKLSGR